MANDIRYDLHSTVSTADKDDGTQHVFIEAFMPFDPAIRNYIAMGAAALLGYWGFTGEFGSYGLLVTIPAVIFIGFGFRANFRILRVVFTKDGVKYQGSTYPWSKFDRFGYLKNEYILHNAKTGHSSEFDVIGLKIGNNTIKLNAKLANGSGSNVAASLNLLAEKYQDQLS